MDESIPKQPLNLDTIKGVFEEILEDFKKDHKNMEMALLNQPFELRNREVVFMLSSGLHEDLFPKLKPELTGILKSALVLRLIFKPNSELFLNLIIGG